MLKPCSPPFTTPLQATFLVPICRSSDFFKRSPRNYCLTLSLRLDNRVLLPLKQCCHVFAVVSWLNYSWFNTCSSSSISDNQAHDTQRWRGTTLRSPLVTEAVSVSSNTEPECITHLRWQSPYSCRFHACHRKKVGLVQGEVSVVTCGHAEDPYSL